MRFSTQYEIEYIANIISVWITLMYIEMLLENILLVIQQRCLWQLLEVDECFGPFK